MLISSLGSTVLDEVRRVMGGRANNSGASNRSPTSNRPLTFNPNSFLCSLCLSLHLAVCWLGKYVPSLADMINKESIYRGGNYLAGQQACIQHSCMWIMHGICIFLPSDQLAIAGLLNPPKELITTRVCIFFSWGWFTIIGRRWIMLMKLYFYTH